MARLRDQDCYLTVYMYEMADFEGSCQSTVYRVQCGNTDTIDFSGNESQNTPNFHKVTRGTMEVVC